MVSAGMLMQDRLQCRILQIPGSQQSDTVQPVEATDSNQFTRRTTHLRPRPSAGSSLQRRSDTCPPNTADRHTSLVIKQYAVSSCKAVNARRTHKLSSICHSIAGG